MRLKVSVLLRYRELLRLARKEGLAPSLAGRGAAPVPTDPVGVRLRRALEEAGGVYVKLGQIAATRVDLLPGRHLRGAGPAPEPGRRRSRPTNMRAVLEEEFGRPVEETFAAFDWEPIAAASIGQTYGAQPPLGRGGRGQGPAARASTRSSSATSPRWRCSPSSRSAGRRSARACGPARCSGQFAESLRAELDFLREVEAMAEMTALLGDGSSVRVPRVHRQLCTRRVLVQERFEGSTLADVDRLDAMSIDRRAVADQLLRTTLEQVLRMGFFHADPHPGNVFVFDDGSLGLIDFGAVGRLDSIQQQAVLEMLVGMVRRDVSLLREAIEQVVDVAETAAARPAGAGAGPARSRRTSGPPGRWSPPSSRT